MNEFKFKAIDCFPYVKGDKHMARLVAYCNFGYNITFFLPQERAFKLYEESQKKNYDISDRVGVYYDNNKQRFAYFIKK